MAKGEETKREIEGLESAIKLADYGLKRFRQTLESTFNPKNILQQTMALEQLSMKMTREAMGQTNAISEAIETTIARASYKTAQFGITIGDNLQLMREINDVMQVNTTLTEDQVFNMQILAKNAGVTSKEISSIVVGFSNIGVGTNNAIENISKMQKQARSYGINVGQFMRKIGENMKLLSTYNFKEGVQGFSNMLAKAQALRVDVSSTFSLAQDLLDPEKAIETAAGFQMLGGAVGDLADPFKLLHMAQNDVGGLQDSLLGMAESAVTFNEKTGEFDIPVTEMYRLREAAKLAGKSYEEFTQDAIKAKQRTEKIRILDAFGQYTDEQKDLIANLGEFDGGTLKVRIPSLDEQGREISKLVDASNLGPEEMAKLREMQEQNDMSDRDIALAQLSNLEKIANADLQLGYTGLLLGSQTKAVTDFADVLGQAGEEASNAYNNVFDSDKMADLGKKLTDSVASGFNDPDANAKLMESVSGLFSDIGDAAMKYPNEINEALDDDNIYKNAEALKGLIDKLKTMGVDIDLDGMGEKFGELRDQFNDWLESQGFDVELPDIPDRGIEFIPQTREQTREQSRDRSETVTTPPTTVNPTSSTNNESNNASGVVADLNVNGEINLKVDGMNIDSETLNAWMKTPEFKSKVLDLLNNGELMYG